MIAVDLFAGGGGASLGIEQAGLTVVLAVNHDASAIEMHAANHPSTIHLREDVFAVSPLAAARGRLTRGRVDLLWASPDCTHHSRAKGGKPRSNARRGLAWVIVDWANAIWPRVIALENVPEFLDWGPLDADDKPIRERRGETFAAFVGQLRLAGYAVDWRVLNAADFGAPTTRKRLFIVARRDGPVVWPSPSHGPGRVPWRTAAECIDWSLPIPSIFDRKKPLAEATQRRIAEGMRRYVLTAARPFIRCLTHGGRVYSVDEPLRTITCAHRGEMALVGAFLAKHYGGVVGQPLDRAIGTVTAQDHHSLVAAHLTKFYGTSTGAPANGPMPTITGGAGGGHMGLVAAFLLKFYGTGGWSSPADPMHTITAKARMGLVSVDIDGEPHAIVDIGMRMLQPRELANAQGFDPDYILTGTKTEQIARIGNSVCPPVARAVVAAQFGAAERLAAK